MELFAFHFIKPADHRQSVLIHRLIGGCAFLLQIALEIFHILRLHAEYGQRFQQLDMLGRRDIGIQLAGTLQASVVAFQAYTASEKLNGLRSLAFCKVDQAHGGNAPAVPALRKLAGANQHVDIGIRRINISEQRF